jgi:hypothetical protein
MALTQQQLADLLTLIDTYAAQSDVLAQQSVQAVLAGYASQAAWTTGGQAAAAGQAAQVSDMAAAVAAGMAAQYLALAVAQLAGPVGVPNFPVPVLRAGKPMEDVFARVYRVYQRQAAKGADPVRALEIAMRYAATITEANVRMSQQHTHRSVLAYLAPKTGIRGYRRVVHPELSRTGTCGLCIVASDNLYTTDQLMPIHTACRCTVVPVIGDADPGSSLNNVALGDVYTDALDRPNALRSSGTHGYDLHKVRYKVVENTETGPTLVNADHVFTPMGAWQRSDDPGARQRRTGSRVPRRRGGQAPAPSAPEVAAAHRNVTAQLAALLADLDEAVRANRPAA